MNWRTQNILDEIGVRLHGFNFNIDIVNACPLRCPTCSVSWRKGDGHMMDFGTFCKILDKAQREFKIRRFGPYLWSEPLLHPDLPRFIREAKRRGIFVMLSTTLNKVNCDLRELMASGIDDMRISLSGWNHYAEHHRGGDLTNVLKNMATISCMERKPRSITVLFHKYKDNLSEVELARRFFGSFGFKFDSFNAQFLTLEKLVDGGYVESDIQTISGLIDNPWGLAREWEGYRNCYLQRKCIQLDAHGQIMLCCNLRDPQYLLGDFLDTSFKDMRKRVKSHPFCLRCMRAGMNTYTLIRDSTLIGN